MGGATKEARGGEGGHGSEGDEEAAAGEVLISTGTSP